MQENIFHAVQGRPEQGEEMRRAFDKNIALAVRTLMASREGRMFLRWLGAGQSAHSILQLIMAYEEERHGSSS